MFIRILALAAIFAAAAASHAARAQEAGDPERGAAYAKQVCASVMPSGRGQYFAQSQSAGLRGHCEHIRRNRHQPQPQAFIPSTRTCQPSFFRRASATT